MLDVLQDYFREHTTPEMNDLVTRAFELFELIGLEDGYEDAFVEIMMSDDAQSQDSAIDRMIALVISTTDDVLAAHGVELTTTASLEQKLSILHALLQLPESDQRDALIAICDGEGTAAEIFSELVTLVTDISSDELLVITQTIDSALITKLKEYLANRDLGREFAQIEQLDLQKHVQLLQRFVASLPMLQLKFVSFIDSGVAIGASFDEYVKLFGGDLDRMKPETAAAELYAMALASCDGVDNPVPVIRAQLESLITDADVITKIDIRLTEFLTGMTR